MKRIRFQVTEQDVKEGARNNIYLCPFALALKRYFDIESLHGLMIGGRYVQVRDGGRKYGGHKWFRLSDNARKRITAFDDPKRRTPVPPGTYEMYVTDEFGAMAFDKTDFGI